MTVDRVPPTGILAVTFTNKAAKEMRSRIEQMMNIPARGLWFGTFHGIAHRLLRSHWKDAGLPENFQVLDSDDQLRLIKRVMREFQIDESQWPPKQARQYQYTARPFPQACGASAAEPPPLTCTPSRALAPPGQTPHVERQFESFGFTPPLQAQRRTSFFL